MRQLTTHYNIFKEETFTLDIQTGPLNRGTGINRRIQSTDRIIGLSSHFDKRLNLFPSHQRHRIPDGYFKA